MSTATACSTCVVGVVTREVLLCWLLPHRRIFAVSAIGTAKRSRANPYKKYNTCAEVTAMAAADSAAQYDPFNIDASTHLYNVCRRLNLGPDTAKFLIGCGIEGLRELQVRSLGNPPWHHCQCTR